MIGWIKSHKLVVLLILILVYTYVSPRLKNPFPGPMDSSSYSTGERMTLQNTKIGASSVGIMPPSDNYAPAPQVSDRMVIQNSYLSLLVKNVRESVSQITEHAKAQGGYMVDTSLQNPQDAASATVTVRIPAKNLDPVLSYFRNLGVKVVSENLTGQDVTDQYVDIDARLATLEKTKLKFEEILGRAVLVKDILEVQRELINLQSQIDSLKGQQNYLSKSAEMAKITLYLSTDEIALPYAPAETWRPEVIFKLAVRSLVGHARQVASSLIWIVVYGVVWIPLLLIFFLLSKRFKR